MIARRAARRVVVKRHHGGEVARGDRRLPRSHREVARQLRPEGRFEREILARDRESGIGKQSAGERHVIVERFQSPRALLTGTDLRRIRRAPAGRNDDRP